MDHTDVAVMPYIPAWRPADTACLVRRTRVAADKIVSTSGRARRKRTVPKDQLALALDGRSLTSTPTPSS